MQIEKDLPINISHPGCVVFVTYIISVKDFIF